MRSQIKKIGLIMAAVAICMTMVFVVTAMAQTTDHVHEYEAVVTDPTCTTRGYTLYACECGLSYKTDFVEATGHDYDAVVTDPTCTTKGYTTYTCDCGSTYTADYIKSEGHVYSATTIEPEIATRGYTLYECECGLSYKADFVDAIGHSYVATVVAPTCQLRGYTLYECECGYSYKADFVPALGGSHTPAEAVTENEIDATCVADGSYDTVVYCEDCGAVISRETTTIPATGKHSYESDVTDPTCTEAGYTIYTCATCGDTYTADEVEATGHTAADAVVENDYDATCADDGSYDTVVYCEACGAELSRETTTIPATGKHSYESDVTAPTCTEAGYTTYTCSECGDAYSEDGAEALGHDYEAVVTEPTCTDVGYTTYTCSVCNDTYSEDGAEALGHDYEAVVTDATCTEAGYTTYTCSVCGDEYVGDEVAALGHSYEGGVCSVCGGQDPDHYFEMSVADALAADDGKNVQVSGTVIAAEAWNSTYNNMSVTIEDENGDQLYVYRLATEVALGDIITVKGTMTTYNEKRQIAQGATAEITGHVEVEVNEYTIPEVLELPDNTNVVVSGTVIKIDTAWSDSYGNMCVTVADENGVQLYVYRLSTKVELNDVITITGVVTTYSGARQINSGATAVVTGTHTCSNYKDATCSAPKTCVVCGATVGDAIDHNYVDGACTMCGAAEGVSFETESMSIAASKGALAGDKLTIAWESDNFSFVGAKATSTTAIRTSDSDHYRVYVGSTFTISAKGTQQISKVVITCTSPDYAKNCANALKTTGATATVSGSVVTITVDSGYVSSIEIGASVQWRLNKVEITYVVNSAAANCDHENTTTTTVDATCTTDGSVTVVCDDCTSQLSVETVKALGHSYDDGEITTDATCAQAGVMTYTCDTCGGTKTEAIKATGEHAYEDGVCTVCGAEEGAAGEGGEGGVETTVSKSHTDIASIAGVTAGQKTGVIANKEIALDDNITIICAKGGSTSDPCIYSESIRLYQNGATLTIKAAEGCTMSEIVITLASTSAGRGPITVTGGTASALTGDDYIITVDADTNEVVIKSAGTDKNSRLYVANISVTYTA